MPALIVIGSQWGDEGKGKLIDILSAGSDFVVRYQGGANAGHTLKVEGEQIIVHLVPSAVFHSQVKCLISGGVVLDLEGLYEEIKYLKQSGKLKNDNQLLISDSATLLLDLHKQLDQAREKRAEKNKIGTTGKGIGPAYESRASRKALLFSDLFEEDTILLNKLKDQFQETQYLIKHFYKSEAISIQKIFEKIKSYRETLKPYRSSDMSFLLSQALEQNKKVLFEGAQGTLLDLYHGTYPYVTSSSTLAGGVFSSCGLGFSTPPKVLAVSKAYSTRVGKGPFLTECLENSSSGQILQKEGQEFGATTGRKRRCGWLDLPALKYAIRLNSASSLALMKLDVLSALKEIKVCVAYKIESKVIESFPVSFKNFNKIKAIYKSFPSWDEDLSVVRAKKDLPQTALNYINFISAELKIPVDIISVGPSRSQTLILKELF
ncbi:MAG: adenylosuccinate synthase [Bdellovibrionaceae bacterium]|nr:adenylosuccinate synthase [Pseudobdellovibrionaceae bacterium]